VDARAEQITRCLAAEEVSGRGDAASIEAAC
jgi:hypothetical protein